MRPSSRFFALTTEPNPPFPSIDISSKSLEYRERVLLCSAMGFQNAPRTGCPPATDSISSAKCRSNFCRGWWFSRPHRVSIPDRSSCRARTSNPSGYCALMG